MDQHTPQDRRAFERPEFEAPASPGDRDPMAERTRSSAFAMLIAALVLAAIIVVVVVI